MADLCIRGFHSNDAERCRRFLSDDAYIIECRSDTEFLGTGMYFWGTESDAKWWKAEKNKEMVVSAVLSLNNILDLTDQEVVRLVESCLEKVDISKWFGRHDTKRKMATSSKKPTGVCLDALFQAFKTVFGRFDILKGRQLTPREETDFFFNAKLTTKAVDIYCVKNANPISEREEVV
jgi:hypothetical protein